MLIEVTVVVGDPANPLMAFMKRDVVYPDGAVASGDYSGREAMAASEATLNFIDEAKASIEKQAKMAAGLFGSGPSPGS